MKHFKIEDSSGEYIKAVDSADDKTYFFKRSEIVEKVILKGDFSVWEVVKIEGDRITAKNQLGSMIEANKELFLPYSELEN